MFNPNSNFLYLIAVMVIIFVLSQSIFFLVRASRQGKRLGMDISFRIVIFRGDYTECYPIYP